MPDGRLDWRAYRIPLANRRLALGRWYVMLVRRAVQSQSNWMELVGKANSQHRDIQNYLNLCGVPPEEADVQQQKVDDVRQPLPEPQTLGDSLVFGEREALELIALAAQEIADRHPFQDHPANQDIPAEHEGLKSGRIRRLLLQQQETEKAKGRRQSVWLGRLRKTQTSDSMAEKEQSPEKEKESELEALFRTFTPRLRNLQENERGSAGDGDDESSGTANYGSKSKNFWVQGTTIDDYFGPILGRGAGTTQEVIDKAKAKYKARTIKDVPGLGWTR